MTFSFHHHLQFRYTVRKYIQNLQYDELKYYIYYLINSKSKEKAVRNAKNKMCLQHCSDVKKVVKAFDVENILCLQ